MAAKNTEFFFKKSFAKKMTKNFEKLNVGLKFKKKKMATNKL